MLVWVVFCRAIFRRFVARVEVWDSCELGVVSEEIAYSFLDIRSQANIGHLPLT